MKKGGELFKEKKKLIVNIAIILGVLIVLVILFSPNSYSGEIASKEFAQCITEKGAVMYGTDWCKFCKKQKEMFGENFKYVEYVNCDEQREVCVEKGIQGYPTWHINEEVLVGVQPLEKLAYYTGCSLEGQDR